MWLGIVMMIGLFGAPETMAQETGPAVLMNLDQCLDRALEVSPDIEQAELAVKQMEARLSEARFAGILPQIQWTNILGPAPGIKGDVSDLESIRNDLSDLGFFSRTSLDVVQPIYTFGKIGGAREAARYGLQASEAGVNRKKGDIALQVKKLYYGLALAKALRDVVLEAQENVTKARNRVNELLEEDSDDVGMSDLLKIDVFEYEVKKNLARVDKSIELGRAALMMTLNLDRNTDFDIAPLPEEPEIGEIDGLDAYIERARATRPDLKQLHAGVMAKRSAIKTTRSDFFPQIAFIGSLQWGVAPHRPHFSNPFLRDEFNFFRLGGVITLRQQFSFGLSRARYNAQKAELADIMSKEDQAMRAVALEVEQAYREALEAEGNVRSSDRAMRSAKSWLTSAAIGFDITGDSSELLNAFTAYSRMRQEFHQAVFNLNVALSTLDHVTGASPVSGRM